MKRYLLTMLSCLLACAANVAQAGGDQVEVLHFWTSPGEMKSIDELKTMIGQRGYMWRDFAVAGGGGQNATQRLKSRVQANDPPAAASMKGPSVQEWAAQGALTNLDAMAEFAHWDDVLPPEVRELVKYKGHYVAVPVNIHRANWLWSNSAALRKAGIANPPTSFDEFFVDAERLRKAGITPLAIGDEPWQEFVLFDSIVLGVAGPDLYRKAFVEFDAEALSSPEMRRSLDVFRRMKSYVDTGTTGRNWNSATRLVIDGRAAFQFMGDWAKGEFTAAGKAPGKDFACSAAPGTAGAFTFVVDTFAMFQLHNWEEQRGQGYLAYALLTPKFQSDFNLRKGSIPVRRDIPVDDFDMCAKLSSQEFTRSEQARTLLPSVSVDMALTSTQSDALRSEISSFWHDDSRTTDDQIARVAALAHVRTASVSKPQRR